MRPGTSSGRAWLRSLASSRAYRNGSEFSSTLPRETIAGPTQQSRGSRRRAQVVLPGRSLLGRLPTRPTERLHATPGSVRKIDFLPTAISFLGAWSDGLAASRTLGDRRKRCRPPAAASAFSSAGRSAPKTRISADRSDSHECQTGGCGANRPTGNSECSWESSESFPRKTPRSPPVLVRTTAPPSNPTIHVSRDTAR